MRVICVVGARPNFMKVKPVLAALEARDVETKLVHTGQHYEEGMSDVFFRELGIRAPDHHLGVGSGTHARQTARIMEAFEPLLAQAPPEVVIVVGDVNSTLACSLVAAKAGCLVAHVEAGLRSRDWGMPEEINRVVTDRLSDYLFAPSDDAVENLKREGYRPDQIHLVGNVMVDTLLSNLDRARARPVLAELGLERRQYALVTLHRPSNVDDPNVLEGVMMALERISEETPVVFPVHPRARRAIGERRLAPGVRLLDPLGYLDFIAIEEAAGLVLTDSGGIQEETTVLGVPCLTVRENTERPLTVTLGTNRVVGFEPDRIVQEARRALKEPTEPRSLPLWDGRAAERIADVLVAEDGERILRPTDL